MTSKLSVLTLFIIAFAFTNTYGQTGVFRTFDDYVNGKMEKYDEVDYEFGGVLGTKFHLLFKTDDGKTTEYKGSEMWGFKYDGHLFKYSGGQLAMALDSGKLWLWDDGSGLDKVRKDKGLKVPKTHFLYGYFYWVSVGVNEEPYTVLKFYDNREGGWTADSFKKFKKKYPEFGEFYECMGKISHYGEPNQTVIEDCVYSYNRGHK